MVYASCTLRQYCDCIYLTIYSEREIGSRGNNMIKQLQEQPIVQGV